jgi:hypothetical protein
VVDECAVLPTHGAVDSPCRGQSGGEGLNSRADNNARFNVAVMPYLNDAYRLARWLTGNRADAEDVVQDAFLAAFRGIGNLSEGNARAWVLTIVPGDNYPERSASIMMSDLRACVGRA